MEGRIGTPAAAADAGHALEEIYRVALRAERAAWEVLQRAPEDDCEAERLDAWREAVAWADAARDAYLAARPDPQIYSAWMDGIRRTRVLRAAVPD
jgi:hypothetical protein